ncbi:hypothetical protein A6E13_16450 [Aliivibrio fischeri]|uniref:hypothetical protein n=1 Tax=Aliivibrio fischeri TaxID=668 RepID=UPI00080E9106|nr:hypothetical protein [Aliivibrio fischeri]OCH31812.1 hypothetical protein A6E13_16450 [Aliivibrio fischeri]
MTEQHQLDTLLNGYQNTLPTTRQGAIVIKKLEMALAPYPAFFREIQQNALEELKASNPEAVEEIEFALESAQQAIEQHCRGLKLVTQLLNND